MDSELKCNRLTCRRALSDKAVVTTCSHIFCVDCANELFNAARLCPACETSLTEPDDVVVCSLHPSNDYKTSVLSGLSPSIILEICGRAISFWQYQIHQEHSFQQAVVRNMNDKNMQLQKQVENVIREANGEINLLTAKVSELERDLELERRKVRDLQDTSRERDKEYQKLKSQFDKIKRKALLAPGSNVPGGNDCSYTGPTTASERHIQEPGSRAFGTHMVDAVLGGMQANGIQRTPLVNRTGGGSYIPQTGCGQFAPQNSIPGGWMTGTTQGQQAQRTRAVGQPQRMAFERSGYRSGTASDRSESVNEVENILTGHAHATPRRESGWTAPTLNQRHRPGNTAQRVPAATNRRPQQGVFRPAPGIR